MIAIDTQHPHHPNEAGTACRECGLAAEAVPADELAAVLIAELIVNGAIDPRVALDAGVVVVGPLTSCPAVDPGECSTIRERSVAGISDAIPTCPVHGAFVDDADVVRRGAHL